MAVLLSLFVVLVLVAAARLFVIPDEAYYWTWSTAPAARYFDHPPAVAWVLAASRACFGDGRFGLRFPSLFALGGIFAIAWAWLGREGNAGRRVFWALAGSPMLVIGFLPLTPDPLLGVWVVLCAYLVARALERGAVWSALAAFASTVGIGIKLYAGFIAVGTLLGLLGSTLGRQRLRAPAVWGGVLLGLLVLSPWLAAEAQAGGGSAAFQWERVLGRTPRGWRGIPLAFGSIALTFGPYGAFGLARAFVMGFRARAPLTLALLGGSGALLAACVIAAVLGSGEANWPLPALLYALPLVVAAWAPFPRASLALGLGPVLILMVLLAHVAFPFLPIPERRDTTLRGAGYQALTERAEQSARRLSAEVVLTRSYQTASLLRYHLRDRLPVIELGSQRASQYDLWPRPLLCRGAVAIVVDRSAGVPPGWAAEVLTAPERLPRGRLGHAPVEDFWLTPIVLTAPRDPGCLEPTTP